MSNGLKVMLVNGSPHKEGCVHTLLNEIADMLSRQEINTEIIWIGNQPISGCIGCRSCIGRGTCFRDDIVNKFISKIDEYDGFIFGTPVHYAAASGGITSFMDRVFFIDEFNGHHFAGKPAAAIASCRRSGGTATIDQINRYFTDSNMPVVPSQYWNVVHGVTPEQIHQDIEGLQIMRTLARNMAWMLKCIHAGKENGINFPEHETLTRTNFIR